jgi:hypothetical protein
MITEKAIYWMAVGLVTLGVGNHVITRLDGTCLATRTMAAIEQISGGPAFEAILDNTPSSSCTRVQARVVRARARMAPVQNRFASMQGRMARQDAICARLQVEKARLDAVQQLQQLRVQVIAPSQSFRVQVPQITIPNVRPGLSDGNL